MYVHSIKQSTIEAKVITQGQLDCPQYWFVWGKVSQFEKPAKTLL
jgi:hypothetical protein